VYEATWHRKRVAVKQLQTTLRTPRLEAALKRETYIMSQLHHPNVARCYGMVLQPDVLALVMTYYPQGTLLQLLQDDSRDLTWVERVNLALDSAEGMAYLHNRPFEPIIHGDLKASNLLIDSDGRVVITDFGLSRIQTITASVRTMTHDSAMSVIYAAPELISNPNQAKTQASDVYAFGMLLYEIATRHPPFRHAQPTTTMHFVSQGGRPEVPEGVPDSYGELMVACWAHAPAARPAFGEIVAELRQLAQQVAE
jgi:serine/threonine protein kinase